MNTTIISGMLLLHSVLIVVLVISVIISAATIYKLNKRIDHLQRALSIKPDKPSTWR